jgi:predicted pyridoxine 5'-phosphate oxidase superfamily flavin-nucleotide-binding protein
MNLSKEQIDFINTNEWVIFATADNRGIPRAAVVIPSRVDSDEIIISDVQMGQSAKNVKENINVFISSYNKEMNKCLKIIGTAEYITSGELFDKIAEFEKTRDIEIRAIIPVSLKSIKEVIEN